MMVSPRHAMMSGAIMSIVSWKRDMSKKKGQEGALLVVV